MRAGATLSFGHKGTINATALAAVRRLFSFATGPLNGKFLRLATSRSGSSDALQKLRLLSRWNLDELESKLGGFRLEVFDL
jgi:hypothetical protein